MVKKRTHYLTFSWSVLEKDSDTGIMSVASSDSYSGWCAAFLNSKSRTMTIGGMARSYSYQVFADAGVEIPVGSRVIVNGKELEVIAVDPLQKHTEIWL